MYGMGSCSDARPFFAAVSEMMDFCRIRSGIMGMPGTGDAGERKDLYPDRTVTSLISCVTMGADYERKEPPV